MINKFWHNMTMNSVISTIKCNFISATINGCWQKRMNRFHPEVSKSFLHFIQKSSDNHIHNDNI